MYVCTFVSMHVHTNMSLFEYDFHQSYLIEVMGLTKQVVLLNTRCICILKKY